MARPDQTIIHSPIGTLGITLSQNKLSKIEFLSSRTPCHPTEDKQIKKIYNSLQHYFKNPTHTFDLPLHLNGTPFQQKVWSALQKIPTGQTITYGELAKKLKTSPRAIGNACRANPIPIVIPCHRVVAQSHLGGYAGKVEGSVFQVKIWLLTHEGYKS